MWVIRELLKERRRVGWLDRIRAHFYFYFLSWLGDYEASRFCWVFVRQGAGGVSVEVVMDAAVFFFLFF